MWPVFQKAAAAHADPISSSPMTRRPPASGRQRPDRPHGPGFSRCRAPSSSASRPNCKRADAHKSVVHLQTPTCMATEGAFPRSSNLGPAPITGRRDADGPRLDRIGEENDRAPATRPERFRSAPIAACISAWVAWRPRPANIMGEGCWQLPLGVSAACRGLDPDEIPGAFSSAMARESRGAAASPAHGKAASVEDAVRGCRCRDWRRIPGLRRRDAGAQARRPQTARSTVPLRAARAGAFPDCRPCRPSSAGPGSIDQAQSAGRIPSRSSRSDGRPRPSCAGSPELVASKRADREGRSPSARARPRFPPRNRGAMGIGLDLARGRPQ